MIDALALGVQHQHPIHMASLADVATNDSMRFTLVLRAGLFFDMDDDGASLNDGLAAALLLLASSRGAGPAAAS